eukprot:jgi/Bigna1/133330/aug1.21_g8038
MPLQVARNELVFVDIQRNCFDQVVNSIQNHLSMIAGGGGGGRGGEGEGVRKSSMGASKTLTALSSKLSSSPSSRRSSSSCDVKGADEEYADVKQKSDKFPVTTTTAAAAAGSTVASTRPPPSSPTTGTTTTTIPPPPSPTTGTTTTTTTFSQQQQTFFSLQTVRSLGPLLEFAKRILIFENGDRAISSSSSSSSSRLLGSHQHQQQHITRQLNTLKAHLVKKIANLLLDSVRVAVVFTAAPGSSNKKLDVDDDVGTHEEKEEEENTSTNSEISTKILSMMLEFFRDLTDSIQYDSNRMQAKIYLSKSVCLEVSCAILAIIVNGLQLENYSCFPPLFVHHASHIARIFWPECRHKRLLLRFNQVFPELSSSAASSSDLLRRSDDILQYLITEIGRLESSVYKPSRKKGRGEISKQGKYYGVDDDDRDKDDDDNNDDKDGDKKDGGDDVKSKIPTDSNYQNPYNYYVVLHRSKNAEETLDEEQLYSLLSDFDLPPGVRWISSSKQHKFPKDRKSSSSTTTTRVEQDCYNLRVKLYRQRCKWRSGSLNSVYVFNNSCSAKGLDVSAKSSSSSSSYSYSSSLSSSKSNTTTTTNHCSFRVDARVTGGGKWYFEVEVLNNTCTSLRVGWGTNRFSPRSQKHAAG